MNRVILLLLGLVILSNSVLACVPAVAIKYIVKHRLEHFNDDFDITEPVRITKKDLEDYFNAQTNPSFRIRTRQNDTTATENPTPEETTEKPKSSTENPKTDEPSTDSTTVKPSNVSTTTAPTSTFKPGTLDDPDFIPGDFVDQHGNPKVVAPPPVTTVLQDFLAEIEKRNNRFLWTGANFLISLASQVLVLIGFTWVLCTYVPFFYMTKGMNSHTLPKSIRWLWEKTTRDNFKIAKSIAQKKIQISQIEEVTETKKAKPNRRLKTKTANPIVNHRISKSTASKSSASKPTASKPVTASEPTASEPTASEPTALTAAEPAIASEETASESGSEETAAESEEKTETEEAEEEEEEEEEAEEEEVEEEEAEEEEPEEEEVEEEEAEEEEPEEEEAEEEEPEAEEAEEVEEEEAEEEEAATESTASKSAASK